MIRRVGWRHRTHTNHCLDKANPPTQTPHIQPVGWLLNALLVPMLLYANPPYAATQLALLIPMPLYANTPYESWAVV